MRRLDELPAGAPHAVRCRLTPSSPSTKPSPQETTPMYRIYTRRRVQSLVASALIALGLASAATAGATDPIPTPEPPDPTPAVCMSQTVLKSFSATGGPFE